MSSASQTTVKEALLFHLKENDLPLDGGYKDKWTPLKFGLITFYLYNSKSRKEAVRLHDIHHIITEYKSDPCGEAEISAWELAAGIYNKYFAGFIGLAALFYGAFLYPKKTFKAFIRGKYSRSLYDQGFSELLLQQDVDSLKKQLLPKAKTEVRLSYILHYLFLVILACTPVLVLILSVYFWV